MRLRLLRAPAALVAALLLPAPTALAAESAMPTNQAKAYGMDWVPYIDPADLPPVRERKVVCLVDSGVGIDEDLPADRPEGPVIARTSLWGDSGLDGPGWENQHGTRMASFAGAVAGNDWGTVGAWPAVRIYSVRAMSYDETVFRESAYRQGVQACRLAATDTEPDPIVAINLSLGCGCTISEAEQEYLDDQVVTASNRDISVLAAAGNNGGTLDSPASSPGIVAVAAGDTAMGDLCFYASYGAGVLVGPGCGVHVSYRGEPAWTDGGGSSTAAMFASTLLALLRTLRPDADRADAERWLREGARFQAGRPLIDGEGAVRAAGHGAVIDRARARMRAVAESPVTNPAPRTDTAPRSDAPSWSPRSNDGLSAPAASRAHRLPRPRVVLGWDEDSLTVRLRVRTRGAERVRVTADGGRLTNPRRGVFTIPRRLRWRVRMPARPSRVTIAVLPESGSRRWSSSRTSTFTYRRNAYR